MMLTFTSSPTAPTSGFSLFVPLLNRLLLVIFLLSISVVASAQTRRYVSPTGTNTNPATATSWATATSDLQGAINSLSSGEVWVVRGTYKPTTTTNRAVGFTMKNGVAIYGGFVGTESSLNQRPAVNPVIGQPSSSTLSGDIGAVGNATDNSYHVIYNSGVQLTNTAVLDGFVITGGNANDGGASEGGGMYNVQSSPTITNCSFQDNSAGNQGGGMYNLANSSPKLTNCSFLSNSATTGGGMANYTSRPSLTNCNFQNNVVTTDGGGIYMEYSDLSLTNCNFQNNSATSGGGIANLNSFPTLTNCTLRNNSARAQGGGVFSYNGNVSLTNCVLFGNGEWRTFAGEVTLRYSLLDAGDAGFVDGGNNKITTSNPFASATPTQLNACSPAINAGLNSATGLTGITTDLAGNPRVYNGGTVDMGAYEYQGNPTTLTVTNPGVSTATVGQGFSQNVIVNGGSGPYSFSVASGSLPTGLSLATTGVLSGTPTQAGSFSITVQATDVNGCVGISGVYSLTATAAVPTISGFAATSNTVCVGSVATFTATVGNVTGSYAYTLTTGSSPITGSSTSTAFSQTLVTSGSGSQSFSLTVSNNGQVARATTSLTVGSHPDYQPLVDLYNSTNGPSWVNKTGWLTGCNPCGWFGVSCIDGRVTRVILPSNRLSGSLPAGLNALTNLQVLRLNNNQLSGGLPASLGALTSLQTLYLYTNQLSGSLPASLGSLINLTDLRLNNNQLDGIIPSSLGALSNLRILYLYDNQLSGSLPANLGALAKLTDLLLNNNQLSGNIPESIGSLINLVNLRLYDNQLSGNLPSSLGALTNLQYLHLNNNQLSGCYPASLTALCGVLSKNFSGNSGLPSGGSNGAFGLFCNTGRGGDAFVPVATASIATLPVGGVVSLSTAGGSSYQWIAPAGAILSSTTGAVVSATLTGVGVQTFTVVVSQGGSCSQTAQVPVTATAAVPTLSGFAATSGTVCVGSVATFTATVGNVTGSYAYTLTNGSGPITGTSMSAAFSQTLVTSGSGSQSFSLTVSNNGQVTRATTSLTVGSHPDYQPLVDLYNSTNGPGWTNKTGWLTGCSPCGWYGVSCEGGRVSGLYLSTNGLTGTIPSSIGNLTSLRYLYLYTNQLSGSIPSSVGSLTNVQIIYLDNNQLSGSLPSSLGNLSSLQRLELQNNQLSGSIPASLSSMPNLQYLYLNRNQLSGSIPRSLANLTNLQELSLYSNQLSGCYPASLTALCGIAIKSFMGNVGLPGEGSAAAFNLFCSTGQGSDDFVPTITASTTTLPVGGVVSLSTAGGSSYQWLAPAGAQLSGTSGGVVSATLTSTGVQAFTVIVSQGGSCSQTAQVLVTATAAVPTISGFAATSGTVCVGSVATFIATVGNVTGSYNYTLTNGSSPITGTSTSAAFSQTLVTSGSGSQSFSLTVSNNGQVVRASTALTVGSHPDYQPLVDLYNSTNGPGWTNKTGWLTDCNPCGWYGVTCIDGRVASLYLSTNGLSGSIPASLSSLTNLLDIRLDNNQLSGSIPASLSSLANLQQLSLHQNQLSGSIPSSLGSLTNLQILFLDQNQLSGSIPESLGSLTNLQHLYLNRNQLIGSIPASLGSLTNLQQLFLNNNQLSGSIPASLGSLTNLLDIRLDRNQLSGSIPASLGSLTNLQQLALYQNQLSGSIPSSLGSLTNLTSLNLTVNQLSGCYPSSLTTLCGLTNIYFANNAGLPGGGSAAAFSLFCSTGQGSDAFVPTATASLSTAAVGSVVSLSTAGGRSYQWLAPTGATLSSTSGGVVSATLTSAGMQAFTVVVSQGGSCSQTAEVSVTATAAVPTISGFAATVGTVCVGSVATFTATVGNVTGSYAYTLTNGSSLTAGTSTNTSFQQNLTALNSGIQSVSLIVSANGQSTLAVTNVTVSSPASATIAYAGSPFLTTGSPVNVTRTGTPGGTYSASPAGLSINTTTGTITPASSSPGAYTVTYTLAASGGCPQVTSQTTLTIQAPAPQTADVRVSVSGPDNPAPGETVVYQTSIANAGPNDAVNVQVTDILPGTLTIASVTPSYSNGIIISNPPVSNIVRTTIPVLRAGDVASVRITATISAAATGSFSNTATVIATTPDADPANNSNSRTTQLVPRADLSITVTDGQTTAQAGSPLTYTIVVANSGPSNATGATVTDIFPASLTGISWTASGVGGGSVGALSGTGNLNESVNLPVGGSVRFIVTGTLSASATGSLTNTATVTWSIDPVLTNNTATDIDVISPLMPTVSSFTTLNNNVCAGSPVIFSASVGNVSGSYAFTLTNGSSTTVGTASTATFSQELTAVGSGLQNFTLTVSANGLTAVAMTGVTVNSQPTASLTSSGTLTCGNNRVTLTAGGGSSYVFAGPGIVSQDAVLGTAVVDAAGLYSVTVTNGAGCRNSTSLSVSADTNAPAVSIDPTNATLTCANPTATLTAVGNGTVRWSTEATDAQITVSSAGVYSVTLTSPGGCTASSSSMVTADQTAPSITLLTQTGQAYPGGQSALTVELNSGTVNLVASSCNGTLSWTGPNGAAGNYSPIVVPTTQVGNFTYTVTCTVGNCTSQPASATVTVSSPSVPAAVLRVLHRDVDNYADNNAVQPMLQVVNEGTEALPLSAVTLRYYLTLEGAAPLSVLSINYAQVGDRNVTLRYVPLNPARQGASGYVEYRFSPDAGSLAPGANSGNIQSYFAKADYSAQNELDDYSYATVRDQLVANSRITAYYNGTLIWGTEPASGARQAAAEPTSQLAVRVLGNPIQNDAVSFEVTGAEGQPLHLQLITPQGRVVSRQHVPSAGATEHHQLSVDGEAAGVFLLQVSTPTQSKTVKVIKEE